MTQLPNFDLVRDDEITKHFIQLNIVTFHDALHYIKHLKYARNINKDDILCVLKDKHGTCSTKHALIKHIADTHGFHEIKLLIGIYKMNGQNTPATAKTLKQYNVSFIPEAHTYLAYNNQLYDFTKANSKVSDFENDLLQSYEIEANQINGYKIALHKNYLTDWLQQNTSITYTLNEFWQIREQCIKALEITK